MDYHGQSWTIGLSWTILDYYGLPWTIMDYHGLSWTVMDCHYPRLVKVPDLSYFHILFTDRQMDGQTDRQTLLFKLLLRLKIVHKLEFDAE